MNCTKSISKNAGRATLVAALIALCVSSATAMPMALINPGLTGTTQYDEWSGNGLTSAGNPGYPAFPGSGAWPGPIGSNALGSGDAILSKIANGTGGGPTPQSASLYFGGFSATPNNPGGIAAVSDGTPVPSLANVVFQIQIGEAFGWDFLNDEKPTLSYNGGTQNLVATGTYVLESLLNGTFETPEGPENVYINTYLLQWNTAALGAISSISLEIKGVQHAQVYAMRLDQSDEFAAVPEPATLSLAGLALLGLAGFARHKKWRRK